MPHDPRLSFKIYMRKRRTRTCLAVRPSRRHRHDSERGAVPMLLLIDQQDIPRITQAADTARRRLLNSGPQGPPAEDHRDGNWRKFHQFHLLLPVRFHVESLQANSRRHSPFSSRCVPRSRATPSKTCARPAWTAPGKRFSKRSQGARAPIAFEDLRGCRSVDSVCGGSLPFGKTAKDDPGSLARRAVGNVLPWRRDLYW